MMRIATTAALAAICLFLSATAAQAEITVSTTGGDLRITAEYSYGSEDYLTELSQGFQIEITERYGRVYVRSLNDVTIDGGWSGRTYAFPTDDIIVNFVPSGVTAPHYEHVEVNDLDLTSRSDDLRISVSGSASLSNVNASRNSHSRITVRAIEADIDDVYARDNLIVEGYGGMTRLDISDTGAGNRLWVNTGYYATDVSIQNFWSGGNIWMRLSDQQDSLSFSGYVIVVNQTTIELGGGSDFVDVGLTYAGSTFGTTFMDGESGSDTVYQNGYWFHGNNTSSVEWFK